MTSGGAERPSRAHECVDGQLARLLVYTYVVEELLRDPISIFVVYQLRGWMIG